MAYLAFFVSTSIFLSLLLQALFMSELLTFISVIMGYLSFLAFCYVESVSWREPSLSPWFLTPICMGLSAYITEVMLELLQS